MRRIYLPLRVESVFTATCRLHQDRRKKEMYMNISLQDHRVVLDPWYFVRATCFAHFLAADSLHPPMRAFEKKGFKRKVKKNKHLLYFNASAWVFAHLSWSIWQLSVCMWEMFATLWTNQGPRLSADYVSTTLFSSVGRCWIFTSCFCKEAVDCQLSVRVAGEACGAESCDATLQRVKWQSSWAWQ